jgi:LacI family transcriptional regulator
VPLGEHRQSQHLSARAGKSIVFLIVKMPTPPVTSMAALARLADCSVMTVSLALRDSRQVSSETRERIRRLAEKHGYRKNPMVAALMATRRSRRRPGAGGEVVALLTKFDEPLRRWRKRQAFYSALHEGMVERSAELGFRLEEFPVFGPEAPDGRQLTRILTARGIRGVVLMPGGSLDRPFPDFDPAPFSTLAAAFHARRMPVHRTASDYDAGIELCLLEAERRGYERVGLVLNRALDPQLRYAFSGRFLAWQVGRPRRALVPLVPGEEALVPQEKFLEWFHRHRPDCLICPRLGVLDWLREDGIRVPQDVGCIFLPVRENREISGFDAQPHHVGRATIGLLARELFLNHTGLPAVPEVLLVGGVWREGSTVRTAPAPVSLAR